MKLVVSSLLSLSLNSLYRLALLAPIHKMVKHTQTIRRQLALKG